MSNSSAERLGHDHIQSLVPTKGSRGDAQSGDIIPVLASKSFVTDPDRPWKEEESDKKNRNKSA